MPSTIVKLSSSDARAWTHNQPVWLSDNGDVARPVTREEQHAISKTLERCRRVKQSFRAELPLLPLNANGRRTTGAKRGVPIEKLDAAFEVSFVGEKRVVTVWNGELRYATGREVLAARLLADHGECVLHGRNGKCIGVLRDPFIREREAQAGPRVQWSRNPLDPRKSEAQRSDLTEAMDELGVTPVRHKKKRAAVARTALARTHRELYSPGRCPNDCRGLRGGQAWKLGEKAVPPTAEEHHPMCKFAAGWAATLEKHQTTEVLYDLETSQVKRMAVPAEIEEADATEARTGLRQVTVSGRVYAVLSPKDAETAALEARGELDAEASDGAPDDFDVAAPDTADEDVEGAEDDEVELPPATSVKTGSAARRDWPSLEDMGPRGRLRTAGEVSARDYLTRPSSQGASSP